MKFLACLAMILALCACSDAPGASRALTGAGYTQVKTDGYRWFGCGQDDTFSTGFTAVGPTGLPVGGVVCSGVLKGSTIRTE